GPVRLWQTLLRPCLVCGRTGVSDVCAPRGAGYAEVPGQFSRVSQLSRPLENVARHEDTTLWWVQAVTGFALFFLASVHLYQMLVHPGNIGPYESADRVWSGRWWPLYLVLLFAVELHGGVGLYRLVVKWGWFEGEDPNRTRELLKRFKWGITVFFLT